MLTIKPSVAAVGRQSGAYLGAGRLESRLSGRSRNSSSSSSSSLKYFTPPPSCVSPGGYRAAGLGARAAGLGSQGAYGA